MSESVFTASGVQRPTTLVPKETPGPWHAPSAWWGGGSCASSRFAPFWLRGARGSLSCPARGHLRLSRHRALNQLGHLVPCARGCPLSPSSASKPFSPRGPGYDPACSSGRSSPPLPPAAPSLLCLAPSCLLIFLHDSLQNLR